MRKLSILGLAALGASVVAAYADVIPTLSSITQNGNDFTWNYSTNVNLGQRIETGDFFTIYDFGPFISGSAAQPSGWSFSSSLVTPPPSGTNPPDSPTLENLTWTYTGSATIPTGTSLGPFSVTQATSIFQEAPNTKPGFFAASATRAGNPSKINNVGQVSVPVPVPEPTTLSLLAIAGIGSAVRAMRRRK